MQSSTYVLDAHTQADGRRYCTEVHVDATGRERERMGISDSQMSQVLAQEVAPGRVAGIAPANNIQ